MSMMLKGANGNEFELMFTRDALPDSQDGFRDTGWSTVTYRVATADDAWQEDSPVINLFEFANLAQWLDAVGTGDELGHAELSGLELLGPELSFTLSGHDQRTVTLRIGFHLEHRPEEFDVDAHTDEAEHIDIHLPRADLLAAAQSLRADLKAVDGDENKSDLRGEDSSGAMGEPDEDLALIDRIASKPPGAGAGEDNAGQR